MDQHPPSLPALGCDALGPQWTCPAFGPVELEGLQAVYPPRGIRPLSRRHDGVGDLSRRTGATARGQVDDKVILGKVLPVGPAWHPGYQLAARIGEGLPGSSVPIGGVAHGLLHRHAGAGLALFHQFQRPQVVRSVAGQYRHGGDQLGVGIHHNRRLVPVKPPAAALVAVAHLRVVHRHHPVLAHPVLEAHAVIAVAARCAQCPGAATAPAVPPPSRCAAAPHHSRATPPAPAATTPTTGPRPLTISASRLCRARLSLQSMAASPLTLEPRYRLISLGLAPFFDARLLHGRQRPHQFDDPVRQQIEGVPHRAPPQDVGRVQRHLHAPLFQIARLPGQPQAGLEYLPHLVVQDQLGSEHL